MTATSSAAPPEAPTGDTLLRIRGLRKSFGPTVVLDGVDLDVHRGEVTVLLGPSGSGKSTLLRCINHLEKPDGGFVALGEQIVGYRYADDRLRELPTADITRQRARIGMVFQQFNLFPHLTVLDNVVEGPITVRGVPRAQARQRGRELLAQVGIVDRDGEYPRRLSGGQQQRVAIARALAMEPELILFDEPTSALDPELVGDVLGAIRDVAATGMTMVVVTHEIGFAREVADRVVFLDGGQIVESGPPATVLDAPRTERARAFLSAVL